MPPIPAKRYFGIGEAAALCGLKAHVIRYWEQEFPLLSPLKRRGRRYFQAADILLVRRIRDLLYQQGFTIQGARERLEQEKSAKPGMAGASDRLHIQQELRALIALCRAYNPVRVDKLDASHGAGILCD